MKKCLFFFSVQIGLNELKKPQITHTRILAQIISGPEEFSDIVIKFLNSDQCEPQMISDVRMSFYVLTSVKK